MILLILINRPNSNGPMNHREEAQAPPVLLESLIWPTADGILKENLITKLGIANSIGFALECSEGEPIIGVEYHFVLDPEILKEKTAMGWEKTGPLAMRISNPTTIKLIN